MVQKLVFGAFNFTPPDSTNGIEPWVTDGTAAGTLLLKDINVGSSGSNPTTFFSVNGKVVFTATTPANGSELWVTDGTTDGTTLLADINPGSGSAGVNNLNFTLLGNKLLFIANSPATGIELWVTDGTSAGTQLLRDIVPGAGNGAVLSKPLAVLGNSAIFGAGDDVWSTDGTPGGTVKVYDFDSNGLTSGAFTDSFYQAGGLVYFTARTSTPTTGPVNQLWATDGTAGGTRLISDLGPDTSASFAFASPLGTLGSSTYFVAQVTGPNGTPLGAELYVSTGTSLELFREFATGPASGNINPDPTRVAVAGNQLFFTREIPAAGNPTELWVIDGATGGTQLLQTFTNITGPRIAVFGDSIVFTATTTVGGVTSSFAPWISDGTVAGTTQLLASNPTASGNSPDAANYTVFGDKLFFTAIGGSATGKELWVTDGTPAGTTLFKDIFPGASASSPSNLVVVGDKLFFQATTSSGREYWVTDGTPQGTVLVKDIAAGSLGSVNPGSTFASAVLGDPAPPPAPSYAIADAPSTAEGGTLSFTVTRDIGTAAGSVALTLGGTATNGADYTAPGLSVSFAAGETSKTVSITTLTDAVADPNETVTLTLGTVTGGGTVSPTSGTATGTITDVPPPPTYAITGTPTTSEGGTLTFTVTRDIGAAAGTVDFALGGTATSGADYAAPAQTVSFAVGETSKTVTIATLTDAVADPNETVTLILGTVTGGGTVSATGGTATGTITDAHISLTELGVAYTQDFNSLQSFGTSGSLPFGWILKESGANANGLYTAGSGQSNSGDSYSFGATASGERALGSLQSGSLSSVFGASFVNDTATAITQLEIAFRGEQWRLGTANRTDSLKFEYSLDATAIDNGTWQSVAALDFRTVDSLGAVGARDGNAAANGTLIASILDGLDIAAGSIFFIRWTDTDSAGADDGLAVDDFSLTPRIQPPPTYAITGAPTTAEGGALTFTVTRDIGTAAGAVALTLGGTATNGADYTAPALSVTFAAGETSKTVSIATLADAVTETDETVTLTLGEITGGGSVNAASGTATGTISGAVGQGVTAEADLYATPTGKTLNVDAAQGVLANDTAPDGGAVVLGFVVDGAVVGSTVFTQANSTVSIGADGSLSFAPVTGFAGEEVLTYRVRDADGSFADATVTFRVGLGIGAGVTAEADLYATPTGKTLTVDAAQGVLANDTAPDGGAVVLGFVVDGAVVSSTVFTQANSTVSIGADGSLSFAPVTGFAGEEVLTYRVRDADGSFADATVTFRVGLGIGAGVTAEADLYATPTGKTLTVDAAQGVLANDTAPDGGAVVLGFVVDGAVVGSTVFTQANSTVSIGADGSLSFAPVTGFAGEEVLTYRVRDADGSFADATVTFRVGLGIGAGVTAEADLYATPTGKTLTVDAAQGVLANDTAPDGGAVVLGFVVDGAVVGSTVFTQANSTVSIGADGSLSFAPVTGFAGEEVLTYRVRDADGSFADATVTFRVGLGIGAGVTAEADLYATPTGKTLTVDAAQGVLANDTAPDGGAVVLGFVVDGAVVGSTVFTQANSTVSIGADGSLSFAPVTGFAGEEVLTYRVRDADGSFADATVTFRVGLGIGAGVTAEADLYATPTGKTLTVDAAQGVLANDTAPDGGAVVLGFVVDGAVVGSTVFTQANSTVSIGADGSLSFAPVTGFAGEEVLTYRVRDADGSFADATVTFTVTPDPVDAVDDAYTTISGVPVTFTPAELLGNDIGAVGFSGISILSANGATLTFEGGAYTYRSAPGFTGVDNLIYTVTGVGGTPTAALVNITVTPDPVDAVDDAYTTISGVPVTFTPAELLGNDIGAVGFSGISILSANGATLTFEDGAYTYRSAPGFTGVDNLIYTVTGVGGTPTAAFVNITVTPDPVDAVDDAYTTISGVPVTFTPAELLGNDIGAVGFSGISILSANGATLTFEGGAYTYRSAPGFTGVDNLIYTVTGVGGTPTAALVNITVTPDPVDAVDDAYTTISGVPVTFTPAELLGNDIGAVGFSGISILSANGATLTFEGGAYTYRSAPGFTGVDNLIYTVTGVGGTPTAALVNITVTPDPVDAVDDAYTTISGVPVTFTPAELLGNDIGAVGFSGISILSANGATLTFEDGAYTYRSAPGFTGVDNLIYTVTGVGGTPTAAFVNITVTPSINAPPVGGADSYTTTYQKALTVLVAQGVLENDTDPNGDALSVAGVQTDVANGTLVLNANGSFTYTPDLGFAGVDSFVYTLRDSTGLEATATAQITVEAPDFNVVAGTRLAQTLRGTDGSDVLLMGNTRIATMQGGLGADVFVFSETDGNGRRETAYIRDYQVGVDAIDLAGATILRTIELRNSVSLILAGGDRDTLVIQGINDADLLTFTDAWSQGHLLT